MDCDFEVSAESTNIQETASSGDVSVRRTSDSCTPSSSQAASSQAGTPKSTFYVDWSAPSVGIVGRDGVHSESKGDFAISLEVLIEAGSKTGYLATVKRAVDEEQRNCFFTMESTSYKSRFLAQINNSFGSGGMSMAFNEVQFAAFIQFLKMESKGRLSIKKAARIIGQQEGEEPTWVLGSNLQIDSQGCLIPEAARAYMWLDMTVQEGMGSVSLEETTPIITTPLDSGVLYDLIEKLESVLQHNFIPAVLVVAGTVMSLHYSTIVRSGGCPIVVAQGDAETGKTTAIRVGLSILGLSKNATYEKVTNAFILERASVSTLPFAIDDPTKVPTKQNDLSDVVVDLYNGGRTANLRRGAAMAKSIPLVAINYSLKQEERVLSRVCVVPFKRPKVAPETEEQQEAFDELDDQLDDGIPSSAIGWAIRQHSLLSKKEPVRQMKKQLQCGFSGRTKHNWALLTLCAKQLLIEAGYDERVDDLIKFVRGLSEQETQGDVEDKHTDNSGLIVLQTVEDLISIASIQPVSKVLEYMRTDVRVGGKEVLVVVLGDVQSSLQFSPLQVRRAIEEGKLGYIRITKDFLLPGSKTTIIHREGNGKRRKCVAILLDKLDSDTVTQLKAATDPLRHNSDEEPSQKECGELRQEGVPSKELVLTQEKEPNKDEVLIQHDAPIEFQQEEELNQEKESNQGEEPEQEEEQSEEETNQGEGPNQQETNLGEEDRQEVEPGKDEPHQGEEPNQQEEYRQEEEPNDDEPDQREEPNQQEEINPGEEPRQEEEPSKNEPDQEEEPKQEESNKEEEPTYSHIAERQLQEKCELESCQLEQEQKPRQRRRRAGELLLDDLSSYYKPSAKRRKNN